MKFKLVNNLLKIAREFLIKMSYILYNFRKKQKKLQKKNEKNQINCWEKFRQISDRNSNSTFKIRKEFNDKFECCLD